MTEMLTHKPRRTTMTDGQVLTRTVTSRLRRAGVLTPTGYLTVATWLVLLFLVLAGPAIWGEAATRIDVEASREGVSLVHPFGTDNAGRDVLARMLAAARLSIGLAVATALLGAGMGIALGAITGVLGPRMRRLLGEAINLLLAFPGILVALFLTAIFGPGLLSAVAALSIASAPGFARLAQTLTASLAQADFVSAARLAGFSRRRILFRHVLPNVAEPLVLTTAAAAGASLLAFASLSFLGLGIQPPNYDWGRVLSEGLQRLYVSPVAAIGPAVIIIVTGMSFNLIGDMLARFVSMAPEPPSGKSTAPRTDGRATTTPAALHGTEVSWDSGEARDAPRLALDLRDLRVAFDGVSVVDGVDLQIRPRERVAVVGESGSGKTLMALAAARLEPVGAHVETTKHHFSGRPVSAATQPALLGVGMAIVFQDSLSSWNPALRIGTQMTEATMVHQGTQRSAAVQRATDLLASVRITSPARRLTQYPHELSGGMRQRASIASGLMTAPSLLVADEPTTALDVTVQRQVLKVLRDSTEATGAALLLISHDLGVVGELCDRALVMYAGRIVEDAPLSHLVGHQAHPYTAALLATMPGLDTELDRPLAAIPGQQPEPADRPSGCPFRVRCVLATAKCEEQAPPLVQLAAGHSVACWHPRVSPLQCREGKEAR